jgi:hypothetical protein
MGQGREAATVRQAILIVLLIAAAFLGGAFVTGPGLQWAKARLLRSLGLSNGGEIAEVDLESSVIDSAEQPKSQIAARTDPIAPMPQVAADHKSIKQDDFDRISQPKPSSMPADGSPGTSKSDSSSLPSATPPRSVTKSSARDKPLIDNNVSLARDDSPADRSRPVTQAEKPPPPAQIDSLATISPATEAATDPERPLSTRRSPGSKSPDASGDEWSMLVRKMQSLGVSRYSVEGEPGGQVVFACLIPLAGRQAISQRFESSGDDVVQAARAALRRVILWRATQLPRNDSQAHGVNNGN